MIKDLLTHAVYIAVLVVLALLAEASIAQTKKTNLEIEQLQANINLTMQSTTYSRLMFEKRPPCSPQSWPVNTFIGPHTENPRP